MPYSLHNFQDGQVLSAEPLNDIDSQALALNKNMFGNVEYVSETLDESYWELGSLNVSTGKPYDSTTSYRTKDFIAFSGFLWEQRTVRAGIIFLFYDKTKTYLHCAPTAGSGSNAWTQDDDHLWLGDDAVGITADVAYIKIRSYDTRIPTDLTINRAVRTDSLVDAAESIRSSIKDGTAQDYVGLSIPWRTGYYGESPFGVYTKSDSRHCSVIGYDVDGLHLHLNYSSSKGIHFQCFNQDGTYIGRRPESTSSNLWTQSDIDTNLANLPSGTKYIKINEYLHKDTPQEPEFYYKMLTAYYTLSVAKDTDAEVAQGNTYAHLFDGIRYINHFWINSTTTPDKYGLPFIPNQSTFDLQAAKRFGHKIYELNVWKTSDGEYICCHGYKGNFGASFTSLDGTDISSTAISSVTYEWITTNVRYVSKYDQYKVAPMTLKDALKFCRINNIMPLVQIIDDDEVDIVNGIMGECGYIAYTYLGYRGKIKAPMTTYTGKTTAADALAQCDIFGPPFIYCMSNINTLEEDVVKDIVDTLHQNGYMISVDACYKDEIYNQLAMQLGFDLSSTEKNVEDFDTGNLINAFFDGNASDFSTTGTLADGKITLTEGQTVTYASSNSIYMGKGTMHIMFVGTITIAMGQVKTWLTNTNETLAPRWFSTVFLAQAPTLTITASADTQIYSIDYKVSRV